MLSFKEFERREWERKASRYQDSWGAVTAQPIDAILRVGNVAHGTSLLDIGCGPGTLCAAATKRGAIVTGCDYSEEMVRIALQNYPGLTFCREDAAQLSFKAQRFNCVTLNYLLLHVADQAAVLREAARVVSAQGTLVYTVWLSPQESPGLNIIFKALKQHADMSVVPPADDIFAFASADRATALLKPLGFFKITAERFDTAWHVESVEHFFSALQAGTRMGGLIELQREEVREMLRSSIAHALDEFKHNNGYLIPMPSLIVAAQQT